MRPLLWLMLLFAAGAIGADCFTTYAALTSPSGHFKEHTPTMAALIAQHGLVVALAVSGGLRLLAFGAVAALGHVWRWTAPVALSVGLVGAAFTWWVAAMNVLTLAGHA